MAGWLAGWLAGYRLTRGPGQDWACGFVEREREEQALGQASGWMATCGAAAGTAAYLS